MKFTDEQSLEVLTQLNIHADYSNHQAIRCQQRYQLLTLYGSLTPSEAVARLLTEHEPFLTELVIGMVTHRITK